MTSLVSPVDTAKALCLWGPVDPNNACALLGFSRLVKQKERAGPVLQELFLANPQALRVSTAGWAITVHGRVVRPVLPVVRGPLAPQPEQQGVLPATVASGRSRTARPVQPVPCAGRACFQRAVARVEPPLEVVESVRQANSPPPTTMWNAWSVIRVMHSLILARALASRVQRARTRRIAGGALVCHVKQEWRRLCPELSSVLCAPRARIRLKQGQTLALSATRAKCPA